MSYKSNANICVLSLAISIPCHFKTNIFQEWQVTATFATSLKWMSLYELDRSFKLDDV